MAAQESTMAPLGTPAPDFDLLDTVSGNRVRLDDLADRSALVVIFLCNHCPFVVHIQQGLVDFSEDYAAADVAIVGISANDADAYPDDSRCVWGWVAERLGAIARARGYRFPVLYDETQEVAKAYSAACTPDFFLFDASRALVYRGRFDDARPNSPAPVTGKDLRAALDAVLEGRPLAVDQLHSIGCSIKWRPGNEPW